MTIIKPNSIAGVTSITAQGDVINLYKSDGTLAGLQLNGVNFNTTAGISTFNNLTIGGTITYQDVAHVDSVGIITAQQGLQVLANGLDVTGVSTLGGKVLINTSTEPSGQVDLLVNRSSGPGSIQLAYNGSSGGAIVPGSAGGLEFFTYTGSIGSETYTERARITSGGEVLIGSTTDQDVKLDVEGSLRAKAAGYVGPTGGTGLEIYYATGTLQDTPSGYLLCYDRTSSAYKKINYDATEHKFRTYGTETLHVTPGGAVVTGVMTATSFSGDGSQLSGISVGITTTERTGLGNTTIFLDLSSAQHHTITLAAGISTIDCTGGSVGESHSVVLINPSSVGTGVTVGFATDFLFPSGSSPALPTGANDISLISFVVKQTGIGGTQVLASAGLDYQ